MLLLGFLDNILKIAKYFHQEKNGENEMCADKMVSYLPNVPENSHRFENIILYKNLAC